MAQNKPVDEKVSLLNTLSTYRTLINDYPLIVTTNSLINTNNATTINFSLDLLKIFGVDDAQLVEMLTGWIHNGGVMEWIEKRIKLVLKTYLFALASCGQSPIIPDYILTKYIDTDGNEIDGRGVDININQIDWSNKLSINPKDINYGQFYYFDVEKYSQTELYKSNDFDAYLWYIINKSLTYPNSEIIKNTWRTETPILYSEFNENRGLYSNTLTFKINYDVYGDKRVFRLNGEDVKINKTIYEFINDYINSVQLFEIKTIISQITNDVLGLLSNVNVRLTTENIVSQQKIDSIITKIIEQDDTEINDCFFSFSNDEYDEMVHNAALKHAGIFEYNTDTSNGVIMDYDDILKSIGEITNNSTLQEQVTSIENMFTNIESTVSNITNGNNNNVYSNVIDRFIMSLLKSAISSILTPKLLVIYMINLNINNGKQPTTEEDFLRDLLNPITQIVRDVKNIVTDELYKYLLTRIEPMVIQFNQKLSLESAIEYKNLLSNLISLGLKFNNKGNTTLDNVNYADIIKSEIESPPESIC